MSPGREASLTRKGMAGVTEVPIDEALFTWPDEAPRLRGGRCAECGAVAFPLPTSCARCTSKEIEEELLPRRGSLWSWTVQRFPPKEPYLLADSFEPYGVGYIDLGSVLVESRLTTADPELLQIGAPMGLEIVPFAEGEDGRTIVTFAFAPSVLEEAQR